MSINIFYDAKRPAADGKWVSIHRYGCIIEYRTHQTEEAARAAATEEVVNDAA